MRMVSREAVMSATGESAVSGGSGARTGKLPSLIAMIDCSVSFVVRSVRAFGSVLAGRSPLGECEHCEADSVNKANLADSRRATNEVCIELITVSSTLAWRRTASHPDCRSAAAGFFRDMSNFAQTPPSHGHLLA
jgi:hypothetical protein